MSKIDKTSISNILIKTDLIMRETDIMYFCEDEKAIEEFLKLKKNDKQDAKKIKEFFMNHEKDIDKEKLLLLTIKNYKTNLNNISARVDEIKRELSVSKGRLELVKEIATLKEQFNSQMLKLDRAIKLAKGSTKVLSAYGYDEEEDIFYVEATTYQELIGNNTNSKNRKNFKNLDEYLNKQDPDNEAGMEYVIQAILLTDLYEVFADEQLGNYIRTMILENSAIRNGVTTKDELIYLKSKEEFDKYSDIVDNTEFYDMLPYIKKVLYQYADYLDLDKLLLVSAYRFEEVLEDKSFNKQNTKAVENLLQIIKDNIKDKSKTLSCQLQSKTENYELENVEYSYKDLKECLSRFVEGEYLTKESICTYREQVMNQEFDLSNINKRYIKPMFSDDELEKIAKLNANNLRVVIDELGWDKDKIIEELNNNSNIVTADLLNHLVTEQKLSSNDIVNMYFAGTISIEQINEMLPTIDLSNSVTPLELNEIYKRSIQKDATPEDIEKYKQYIDLYKNVKINAKNEEELNIQSNKLMETIIESSDDISYKGLIKEYYKQGLLTLDSILDWDNEKIVDILYNEQLVSLDNIQKLVANGKIPLEYLNDKYSSLINNEKIDYDQRLEYIKTGFVSENDILKLFQKNLIFEKDLDTLVQLGIIRKEKLDRVIQKRTKEELEKNSSIKLLGLNVLEKRNNSIYTDDEKEQKNNNLEEQTKSKLIIDPNERADFINLFNAYKADTDLDEESPFYNYEFYVIPDESGEIGINSVVIAERYYDDKNTEEKFALNNATYFFKYKDLMVLSNLKKSEMTQERKNVVFTANHRIGTNNKNGYWAAGVIYGIARTMLSSDLSDYSKNEQRKRVLEKLNEVYSNEEIMEILDKATQIDSGEYTYEIVDSSSTALKTNKVKDENIR